METSSPPEPAAETAWSFNGRIPPAPIGPLYKLGTALNALGMLLLPALYLAMIGGVGWGVYNYALTDTTPLDGPGSSHDDTVGSVIPLVVGVILLIFMVKPLFARRPKAAPVLEITRAEEPRLFAFIDEICAQVRAPRPRHVVLDLQVNASAGFSREFGSFFGRKLTLTIGLPLAAGLSVQDFGGVLAHEFGHFAQGAGMRLTYVIRSLNMWFARLVYERDNWDEFLRMMSTRLGIRIGIVFYLARMVVWLTRKILWAFMWVGHGLSCFMMRQMEFDADYYQTQLTGSEAYRKASEAIRVLSVGWQKAINAQQESFAAGRLVNDLPSLVALETQRVSPEIRTAIAKAAAESKTGWFDTHPSDGDRLQAAEKAQAVGVLTGDGLASGLFADFAALAQKATAKYYEQDCEIDLKRVQLLSLETVAGEVHAFAETEKATEDFFHGLLTVRTMLILSPDELHRTPPLEQLVAEWRDAFQRQAAALPGAEKLLQEMLEADQVDVRMEQARLLLQAGFTIKARDFHLPKGTTSAAFDAQTAASQKINECRVGLEPVRVATRDRVVAALRAYYLEPRVEGIAPGAREEIELLTKIIGRLDELTSNLTNLRKLVAALDLLLRNLPKEGNKAVFQTVRASGSVIARENSHILRAMEGLEYPFEHARGKVRLADFFVESVEHADESVFAFLRAQAMLERLFTLYFRMTGRLAQLALQAEQTVFAEPPKEPIAEMQPQSAGAE